MVITYITFIPLSFSCRWLMLVNIAETRNKKLQQRHQRIIWSLSYSYTFIAFVFLTFILQECHSTKIWILKSKIRRWWIKLTFGNSAQIKWRVGELWEKHTVIFEPTNALACIQAQNMVQVIGGNLSMTIVVAIFGAYLKPVCHAD